MLKVRCHNCSGKNHLAFVYGEDIDECGRLEPVDVGDEFKVKTTKISFAKDGDTLRVTSVANHPLYDGYRPIVALVNVEIPSFRGILKVETFSELVRDEELVSC